MEDYSWRLLVADVVRDAIYRILWPLKNRYNISGKEAERIEDDVAESILSEMRLDRCTHLSSDDLSAIQRRVISKVDHRLHRGSGVHHQTNVQRDEPRHERDAPRRDRDEPRWDRDVPRRERDVPQTTSGPTPRDSGAGGGFAREQLEPGSQGSEMSDREMARGFGKGGGSYGGGGGSSYGKGGGEYDGKGGGKQYGTGGFGRSNQFAGGRGYGGRGGHDGEESPPSATICQCDVTGSQGCIYERATHTVSPEQLLRGESLLGDHAQLCAAFFHTHASSEAGNDELCLDPTRCVRKPNVVLIARLERVLADASSEPLYTCRYTNCMARQPRGGRQAVHAEQFMLDDARLHALLRAEPLAAAEGASDGGGERCGEHGERPKEQPRQRPRQRPHLRLTLLLTQQPCHFSSGRVENAHATAKTSCSIRLIEWLQRERLHERRVELNIKLSRIFRAHWTDDAVHTTEAERVVFSGRASAAREGLVLLMQAGWRIEMLSPEDWTFLIGHSDPYVGRGEAEAEAVDERSGERCGVCATEAANVPPEAEAKAGEGRGVEPMDTQADAEEHPLPPALPRTPSPALPPPPPCTCLFRSDVDATNMSFANDKGRAVQWWEAPRLADGGMGAPWRRVSDPTLAEDGGIGNGLREGTGKILMNASQVEVAMRVAAASTDVVSAPRSRGARRAVVTRACRATRDGQDAYFVAFLAELDARVRARGQQTDRHDG